MVARVATELRFRWSGIRILPDPGERPQAHALDRWDYGFESAGPNGRAV
jgi:hypothetical protein